MGAGSNPAVWFVGVAFLLTLIRSWISSKKEGNMAKTRACELRTRHNTPAKRKPTGIVVALLETIWAISTNWAAALVTLPIHAKGAPIFGSALHFSYMLLHASLEIRKCTLGHRGMLFL
jgi:hypothetical protein